MVIYTSLLLHNLLNWDILQFLAVTRFFFLFFFRLANIFQAQGNLSHCSWLLESPLDSFYKNIILYNYKFYLIYNLICILTQRAQEKRRISLHYFQIHDFSGPMDPDIDGSFTHLDFLRIRKAFVIQKMYTDDVCLLELTILNC